MMGIILIIVGVALLFSFGFMISDADLTTGKSFKEPPRYFITIVLFLSGWFITIYGILYTTRHFEDVDILAKFVNHDKTVITSEADKLQAVTLEINGVEYTFYLTDEEIKTNK